MKMKKKTKKKKKTKQKRNKYILRRSHSSILGYRKKKLKRSDKNGFDILVYIHVLR